MIEFMKIVSELNDECVNIGASVCVTLCGEAEEQFVSFERFNSWSQLISQEGLSL